VTFEPDEEFSNERITDRKVIYLKYENLDGTPLLKRIVTEIKKSIAPSTDNKTALFNAKAKQIIEYVKNFDGEIIAVDFFALWCAQQAGKKAHFLSLEIYDNDIYRNNCSTDFIKSVIIQSEVRFNFLFPSADVPVFYIQNAPVFVDINPNISLRSSKNLVYCGSALPWFGLFSCLEFIADYPEYTLTLKGAVPKFVRELIDKSFDSLVKNGNLIINEEYLGVIELTKYLTRFYAGFVFYDYYRYQKINTFNYQTAPSGKLFQLYNSGVPVIVNNLVGLNSAKVYHAGEQVDNLSSKSIFTALKKIESQYDSYVEGAQTAAKSFDFNSSVAGFLNYMAEDKPEGKPAGEKRQEY
jgi:hypothetical protein